MSTLTKLKKLYEDPEIGLVGKYSFMANLDMNKISYNPKNVDKLFEENYIALNKPANKKFRRRKIFVSGIDDTWGADLINMNAYKEENNGLTYFLLVVDFFSKYLWVMPLRDAKAVTITDAFSEIFKEGRKPLKINTDMGSEFKGSTLKLFKEMGIEHYFSYNDTKVPMAERVARTLKLRIGKYMDAKGTYRFIDQLQKIVNGYNNTRHSSTKLTPKKASLPENQAIVYNNLFGDYDHQKCIPQFEVGDIVRISIKKGIFEKEAKHKWSTTRFKVIKVHHTDPCTYSLEDYPEGEEILGTFYTAEMQKTSG